LIILGHSIYRTLTFT